MYTTQSRTLCRCVETGQVVYTKKGLNTCLSPFPPCEKAAEVVFLHRPYKEGQLTNQPWLGAVPQLTLQVGLSLGTRQASTEFGPGVGEGEEPTK